MKYSYFAKGPVLLHMKEAWRRNQKLCRSSYNQYEHRLDIAV